VITWLGSTMFALEGVRNPLDALTTMSMQIMSMHVR
jgi:hypothetical protein